MCVRQADSGKIQVQAYQDDHRGMLCKTNSETRPGDITNKNEFH